MANFSCYENASLFDKDDATQQSTIRIFQKYKASDGIVVIIMISQQLGLFFHVFYGPVRSDHGPLPNLACWNPVLQPATAVKDQNDVSA